MRSQYFITHFPIGMEEITIPQSHEVGYEYGFYFLLLHSHSEFSGSVQVVTNLGISFGETTHLCPTYPRRHLLLLLRSLCRFVLLAGSIPMVVSGAFCYFRWVSTHNYYIFVLYSRICDLVSQWIDLKTLHFELLLLN